MGTAERGGTAEEGVKLSISAGVGVLAANDDGRGEALLARADVAFYHTKRAGKGCVVMLASSDVDADVAGTLSGCDC